ncbi:MAG TPA: hypothetical protein VLA77_01035 [Candidatus Saccharimonadales bacterium]|nr:hypothetical protein [Candidatus Saccharimonadales bacterium]
MRQLPLPSSAASASLISTLADLVTIAGGLLAIGIAIWQFRLYRQLGDNQKAIEAKQAEIDAVPDRQLAKAQQHGIAQPILDRMIVTAQAPLKHELELLERDRKFIKDKLLFAKK